MVMININLEQVPLDEAMERVERELYKHAMEAAKFNKSRAAALLGVSRGSFHHKLRLFYPGVYS